MTYGPLIDLPLVDYYKEEDISRDPLINGNFEGGVGPANWTALTAIISRESGTRTGGSGIYVGQVAYNGVNPTGRMYQNTFTVGTLYRVQGWYKTDGVTSITVQDGLAGIAGTFPASAAWAQFSVTGIAAFARLDLMSASVFGAGNWIQFDDITITPFVARTKNQGSLFNSVMLGDGITPTLFPTVIDNGRRGFRFDGTSDHLIAGTLPNSTYTVCSLLTRKGTSNHYMLDARTGGGTGFILYTAGALTSSSGTVTVDGIATGVIPYATPSFVAVSGMTINASTKTTLFSYQDASQFWWNGDVHNFAIFPGTLTPVQLRAIEERWKLLLGLYR